MRFANKFPYTNINNINLDWIIKRVKELGETVLSYAADIANAVALAEAAQEAADSVTATAESAVTTAQAAEATANAIAGTANSALTTAQAAETTAQAAETTANAIAGTANTALATAQAAETTAQAAEETARSAEERAENAETIAGTASANASNAGQTANTALATAQAAEATAEAAEATADNAETIAGAASINASNALQTANTALVAAQTALNEKAGALITTTTGAIASFLPDATIENYPLGVNVDIEPVQAGSGDPDPDNVRPISGWNTVNIMHSGENTSNPTTYPVPLGQTVYGGTLTISEDGSVNALVDRAAVDFADLNWGYGPMFYATLPNANVQSSSDLICSVYPYKSVGDFCCYTVNGKIIRVNDSRYNSAASFKAALTGQKICYKLATPIEIQLDPVQIVAIAGQENNVWSDAGNVTVEFAADLKWYIDSKITELQALVLENGG